MPIIDDYAQHLFKRNLQKNSISSYVSDVQQFAKWKETNSPLSSFDEGMVYQYLRAASFTRSPETMKRKEVSLINFVKWINEDSANTYTNNSMSLFSKKYFRIAVCGLALLIVSSQIYISKPWSINSDLLSESINNPLSQHYVVTNSNSSDNFDDVKAPIAVAVSGYEISPEVSMQYPSPEKSMVLSLQDETSVNDDSKSSQVRLSPVGGTEHIEKGKTHTIIYSDSIREDSIITVTPTASTQGQTLFIKDQRSGFAVVAMDEPIGEALPFNWIVLQ